MSAVIPLYVKTAYHDEPSFADTKVISSLYSQTLHNNLGTNFKKCLEFRDAKAELLESYADDFDFDELGKLAIDYSDGIILADKNVNKSLEQYAKDKQIPVLEHQEDFAESYEDFYQQIYPEEE